MTRALNILLGAVIGFTAHGFASRATEFFVEQGQCRFGLERDGTFYQSDLYTRNHMNPGCASLGIQDKWKGFDKLGWAIRFTATGPIQARSNIAVNDETRGSLAPCNPSVTAEEGCMIEFSGEGRTQGISLGLTFEQPLASRLYVIGEAGYFFFQHHFKSEAQFIACCGRSISYNETSKFWDQPIPMAGVTLRYRDVYLAARHYWPGEHRPLTLTNNSFWQLILGAVLARF